MTLVIMAATAFALLIAVFLGLMYVLARVSEEHVLEGDDE